MTNSRMDFITQELDRLRNEGLYNHIRVLESAQGAWLEMEGKKVLNLCSNNYLGLAGEERIVRGARKAMDAFGVGPGAVRSIAGTLSIHEELERELAAFKGAEAALVVQSGFCANLSVIPALVGKEDLIFSDELNHASIIDGCRLSRAKVARFDHASPASLEARLEEYKSHGGRKLVITDGVFSMDGDVAPLPELLEVAEKYHAMLMVDDAHGEGVLGSHGRGIVDHFGLHGKVDVEVGTLSKAFGVVGGFVAGSKELVEFLYQKARPFLFSSAMTVPDVGANLEAVAILQESDALVSRLWENGRIFKEQMSSLGFDTGKSDTPITPVMIGDAGLARKLSAALFERGVFAQAIAYPTVPMGTARIRVMISAAHSEEDLGFAVKAFGEAGRELGIIS